MVALLIEDLVQVALRKAQVLILISFDCTLGNSVKNYISVLLFLKDGLLQVALRKVGLTCPFGERALKRCFTKTTRHYHF